MVWYNLQLGNHSIKYTSIKPNTIEYKDVNKDGKPIKKIVKQKGVYVWVKEDNTEVSRRYKLINNKVVDKLQKTKNVRNFKIVNKTEALDLMSERYYLISCDTLDELNLQEKDKAIKFVFSNGNGFKVYVAYIFPYGNRYLMVLGQGYISKQIQEMPELKNEIIKAVISEVEPIKAEEIAEALFI